MQSPVLQDSTPPINPEINFNTMLREFALTQALEGWRDSCWFVKPEVDDLQGYLFTEDAEVRRVLSE